ncbi:hypothetical protein HYFRA_00011149 [Hymenoscyphus fraxineus]|uniref:Uncharacterized protein n=1 Tax=Hymenoscyphus fraxineus TaxID=746836 RepID=A0A9N9L2Y5_9HELO|nr:hypothetical protein HYFRA_00011149 [Hymenoscyphus fraxineus]
MQVMAVEEKEKETSFQEAVVEFQNKKGKVWVLGEEVMAGGQQGYYSFDCEDAFDVWKACVAFGSRKEMT